MLMSFLKRLAALSFVVVGLAASMQAQAVPTYAWQIGMTCAACHFQNYASLNQFGRSFKANGYAFSVAALASDAPAMSLRGSINAGLITKICYQKPNGPRVSGTNNTNDGEFQFPDESLLNTVKTKASALDAQAQGIVGKMPLGIYLSYASAEGTPAGVGQRNLFNANPKDRKGENGKLINRSDNAWMIGATYSLLSNVQLQLQLNHTEYSGSAYRGSPANGARMTTLMLYSAF